MPFLILDLLKLAHQYLETKLLQKIMWINNKLWNNNQECPETVDYGWRIFLKVSVCINIFVVAMVYNCGEFKVHMELCMYLKVYKNSMLWPDQYGHYPTLKFMNKSVQWKTLHVATYGCWKFFAWTSYAVIVAKH